MAIENWIFWLAVAGTVDSFYTALQQRFPKLFEFCFTPDTFTRVGCYDLLHSKYARLLWVPNSWLGTIGYALIAWIFYSAPVFLSVGADRLYLVGAGIATIAFGMSAYLVYVQFKKLEKLCIFCLTSAALITAITVLAWIAATSV